MDTMKKEKCYCCKESIPKGDEARYGMNVCCIFCYATCPVKGKCKRTP